MFVLVVGLAFFLAVDGAGTGELALEVEDDIFLLQ